MNSETSPIRIGALPDHLLARGIHAVTTGEVMSLTALDAHAVHEGMARLRAAGKAFSPAKGLYVIIPPQYRSWKAVPALDFIDPMMTVLGRDYYVGLLSAAELYGAAHQRPQALQVMVDRHVADRTFGRVDLRFLVNRHAARADVVEHNSATGTVRLASRLTTALDLATRPRDGGGLSNVATVVHDMAEGGQLDLGRLRHLAQLYPLSTIRRLGWLLEHLELPVNLAAMEHLLPTSAGMRATTLLDPSGPRSGSTNRRWGLVENAEVEPDR
jgi:predicted transcriptional regulator of viral defense system